MPGDQAHALRIARAQRFHHRHAQLFAREFAGRERLRDFHQRAVVEAVVLEGLLRRQPCGQRGRQRDQAQRRDLGQRQRFGPGLRVVGVQDREQAHRGQRLLVHPLIGRRRADHDAQVDAVVHGHFHDFQPGARAHRERDARVGTAHRDQGLGQQHRRGHGDRTHAEPVGCALADIAGQSVHGLHARQRIEHFGNQRAALAGQMQAPVLAAEQRKAQPRLHVLEQRAGRGLGHVDGMRGGGHRALLVHGAQQQKLSSTQHMNFV